MTEKNIFKGLNLDRAKLLEWIQEFAEIRFSSFQISEINLIGGTQHRCTLKADSKDIMIDFYFLDNGKTTIRPVGHHVDLGVELATHIRGKLQYGLTDRSGDYSVCPLAEEDLQLIVEYLEQELDEVKKIYESYNETQRYKLYQFQSKIADKITLKYYETTQRLQVQGKPMYLYQEVTCLLSNHFPFDEVIKNQSEFFSVDIRPEEVREEMQELLPSAYNYLGENLKKVLSGSLALSKIDIPLEDYTPFVFPVLKTLEGYIKQILLANSIIITKKQGIGELFEYDKINKKHVYLSVNGKELDGVTKSWVETLYNYFNKQRHTLFHAEAIDAVTRIIETKQQANSIIFKVIELVERSHMEITKAAVSN